MDIEQLQKEFEAIDLIITEEQIKHFINTGYTIEEFKEKFVNPYDSFWIRSAIFGEVSWYTAEVEIQRAKEFYKRNEV